MNGALNSSGDLLLHDYLNIANGQTLRPRVRIVFSDANALILGIIRKNLSGY